MAATYSQDGCNVTLQGKRAPTISPASAVSEPKSKALQESTFEWKKSRYEVSMEEFDRLKEKAHEANELTLREEVTDRFTTTKKADAGKSMALDGGLDAEAKVEAGSAPGIMNTFEGIQATGWYPADCTVAVGKTQVLLSVNSNLEVYDKTGNKLGSWPNLGKFFGSVIPAGIKVFDPVLLYDQFSDRFVVIAVAVDDVNLKSLLMIGVSDSDDACGPYWVWSSDATLNANTATNDWGDYPIVGYDEDAIFVTLNMFQFGGNFTYSKMRIFNKAELLGAGVCQNQEIRYWDIWNIKDNGGTTAFSINPCIHYRTAGLNLPAYMMNAKGSGTSLNMWTLTNALGGWAATPINPTLTADSIACMYYGYPPDAEQKGSGTLMATNDTRLLSAVYMDDGTDQSIWACHCSQVTWPGEAVSRSGGQWYQVNASTKAMVQQNVFGAAGMYYFFPAIEVDQRGSAYMIMARSSATEYASLYETGRRPTDTLGEMQPSVKICGGEGAYTVAATRQRWGDYFTAVRDGQDLYKVWVYGQYPVKNNKWSTWCASLRI